MTATPNASNPLLQRIEQRCTNPLREHVGPMRSPRELMLALTNRPINPDHVAEVPLEMRHLVISEYKEIFVPTLLTLEIAVALQDMLYEGLDRRDPRLKENRNFIVASAALKGKKIGEIPMFPRPEGAALGMLIEGITGTGKSAVVERFLKLLPRTVDHASNPSYGWASLKQLVYLRVHMPSDGSRGGFLTNAFMELDAALGTNYFEQYKGWTVERQLVIFLHLLALHRCGLLVIDEAQQNALSSVAPYGREFLTFFLRLLNFGIPTVLIGNPLAFTLLNQFSQDECRFSESGSFRLEPTIDSTSREWTTLWIPLLWGPTLLDEADAPYMPVSEHPLDQTLPGFLWRRTGGFPRFLSRLRREVQARALALGLKQVTPQLVDEVYRTSPKFIRVHRMIDAFVRRDSRLLKTYLDIPSDDYENMWKPSMQEGVGIADAPAGGALCANEPVAADKPAARKKSAKAAPKASKKLPGRFSPEDIRSEEFQKNFCADLKAHVTMG